MKKATLTARSLKKTYGPYVLHVLAGHLVEDDNGYTLIEGKTLPTPEEYNRLAEKYYTYPVDSLVDDAFSVIEELAGEMREGFDNMEGGNLGNTQKCQTYGETADTLESIEKPEMPDCLSEIETVRFPTVSKSTSRAHRASEAASDLNVAADAIDEWVTDRRAEDKSEDEEELDLDGLDSLAEDLRNAASELEGCEFPGMFG
jgi:hypothetical protein